MKAFPLSLKEHGIKAKYIQKYREQTSLNAKCTRM